MISLFLVVRIVKECSNEFLPFSKQNIKRIYGIRICICIMFFAIVPMFVELILNFIIYLKATGRLELINILMFFLGGAVWAIANVFSYGSLLQEDVDLIA